MPKVSVLVPVYNVEKYIRRCIISIQRQSLSDIEIIVVNDGTPDNSMAIVQELAENDQRIKILNHEQNMGLMWTRRTGYMAAKADYIAFCDSDDYLPEIALETLYDEAFRTNADIVSGDYVYVTTDCKEEYHSSKLNYGTTSVAVLKSLLRNEYKHSLCGKLFKRKLLQDFAYQTYEHATNGEDGILFYQLLANTNSIAHINTNVYYYMQNMKSSTQRRYNENAIRSICLSNSMKVRIISKYPELEVDLKKHVTNYLCSLYANGYGRNVNLRGHICQNGLEVYTSLWNIIKYLDFVYFLKIYIGRIVR